MKQTTKKLMAVGLGALVIGTGAGALGTHFTQDPQIEYKYKDKIVETQLSEVDIQKIKDSVEVEPVIIEKNKTITVTEEVVPESYSDLLEVLELEDGDVSYLTEDLDDDEVEQIVERLSFIFESKELAVQEVKKEVFDELDKEVVNSTKLDEDDMKRIDIDSDFEDITIVDVDYDYSDVELEVTGEFEHEDVDYEFVATVIIEDGKVEDFEIKSVQEQ